MQRLKLPSPITEIHDQLLEKKCIQLFLKRDDLIHPEISGNKWRKLKFSIAEAKKMNAKTLLTFGGAYSNHIAAVAAVGKMFNFLTKAIVRGEEVLPLNPTLELAERYGMELEYCPRSEYQQRKDEAINTESVFVIPEGGANENGVKGCEEIVNEITISFDVFCCPCGTGTTLAGIIRSLNPNQKAIGFPAMKGGEYLEKYIKDWAKLPTCLLADKLQASYHFGGFAKFTPDLIDFVKQFEKQHNILLDPIYTSKMMFGIFDLIQKDYFPSNTTIIAIHTGGLQGWKGFEQRFGITV